MDYHTLLLTNFSVGSQTRDPHVTREVILCSREAYWNFSNYYHFGLVDPRVFKSEPASEQAPFKRT